MFKDYYKILGISKLASSQEIKSAYRAMSMRWHPDKNPNADVTNIMQDINEAYTILKDENKRERYDKEYDIFFEQSSTEPFEQRVNDSSEKYEYHYDVQDDTLREDIADARRYAKDLVNEFFKSFKKASQDAASGAWEEAKVYIYAGIFLTILVGIIGTCIHNMPNRSEYANANISDYLAPNSRVDATRAREFKQPIEFSSAFHAPQSWTRYFINNKAFSISVPNTMELHNEYMPYTKILKNIGIVCDTDVVVFQQKGLASNSSEAHQHYCCIVIQHGTGNANDFLRSNQIEAIDLETKSFLYELVKGELGNFKLLGEPSYQWIDINNIKAIETKYRRSGNDKNTTCCTMYLLFNYDEMVKMVVAYREQEKDLWLPDLNNVIKTFKWK